MKNKVMVASATLMFLLGGFAYANEHFNVDEKVHHMKVELNLTDAQANAVKPILEDFKNTMELAEKEKKHRLAGVLTDDQMKKIMDMKHDRRKDKD